MWPTTNGSISPQNLTRTSFLSFLLGTNSLKTELLVYKAALLLKQQPEMPHLGLYLIPSERIHGFCKLTKKDKN
jgi:hypothetical protein